MRLDAGRILSQEQNPKSRENRKAHAMPIATPSPWTRRCGLTASRFSKGFAEGLAEIEQRAFALLGLVGGDNARLGRATRGDRFDPAPDRREHTPALGFQPFEEVTIGDKSIFDDLRVAGAKFAPRQSVQRSEVSARTSKG